MKNSSPMGSLSLTLAARPAEMPGEAFNVSAAGQEVTLLDPFRAREYALRVEDYSVEELPGARIAPKLAGRTFYCAVIGYTLSPEPPEGVEWLPVFRAEAAEGLAAALI